MSNSKTEAQKLLIAAVRKGKNRRVKELLAHGVSADTRTADGTPVLAIAVAQDDAFNVIHLLSAGADPNACDAAGRPIVSEVRSISVAKLLIERGLDMAAEGFDGAKLLEVAAREGEAVMVQDLLSRGVPLPKKMLLTNFWFGLDPKSEQARRVINAHRMADRLHAAMGSHEEEPSAPTRGMSPL